MYYGEFENREQAVFNDTIVTPWRVDEVSPPDLG